MFSRFDLFKHKVFTFCLKFNIKVCTTEKPAIWQSKDAKLLTFILYLMTIFCFVKRGFFFCRILFLSGYWECVFWVLGFVFCSDKFCFSLSDVFVLIDRNFKEMGSASLCFSLQNSCNASSATGILYDPPLGFRFRSRIR